MSLASFEMCVFHLFVQELCPFEMKMFRKLHCKQFHPYISYHNIVKFICKVYIIKVLDKIVRECRSFFFTGIMKLKM